MNDDASLMDVRKKVSEMEEAYEELAARQDETDVSVVKVLDHVEDLKRWMVQLLRKNGLEPQ